jgi:pSer/pThr/pTyr-binding forkhead associated (FHA) protein
MQSTQVSPLIYFQSGSLAGNSFQLQMGANTLGRDPVNHIVVPDSGVSRNHAQLTLEPNGCWIADLDSSGGTYVNNNRISTSLWLQHNDQIQLSNSTVFIFQNPPDAQLVPPSQPAQPTQKSSGCFRNCIWIIVAFLVISCCCIVLLGGSGFYLYQSGELTPRTVLNSIGFGVGEIRVINLANATLQVDLYQLETESGSPSHYGDLSLDSLDRGAVGYILPGSYELRISYVDQVLNGGSCWMQIESGDVYQLVAVPEGIAISLDGYEPSDPAELDINSSSLCRP